MGGRLSYLEWLILFGIALGLIAIFYLLVKFH